MYIDCMSTDLEKIEQLKVILRKVAPVLHAGHTDFGEWYECFFCDADWGRLGTREAEWHEDGCVVLQIDEVLNGNEVTYDGT